MPVIEFSGIAGPSPWVWLAASLCLGMVAGLLAGLLGVGGGVVIVPGLSWLLARQWGLGADISVKVAIGTSLAVICFSSLASVRAHAQRDAVRWSWVAWLAPGIAVGCAVAASVAHHLPGRAIVVFFCCFLLVSAWRTWQRTRTEDTASATPREPTWPWASAAGLSIGGLAGLIGGGGAFISVPLMRQRGMPIHSAVGTAAALGWPIASLGAAAYLVTGWSTTAALGPGFAGYVHLPSLVAVALASVLLAPVGARWAHVSSRRRLEQVFALTQALLGAVWLLRTLLASAEA